MKLMRIILVALAMSLAVPAVAQGNSTSNMEILRDKIKADKKLVVAANMELTDAEGQKFWLIYDDYQSDLSKINMQTGDVIKSYANAYNNKAVTNETAKKLVNEAMAVEQKELELKRAYFTKVETAIGSVKAARYIQIENKIRALIKFELADKIPLLP